jgi:hypothetical protein
MYFKTRRLAAQYVEAFNADMEQARSVVQQG